MIIGPVMIYSSQVYFVFFYFFLFSIMLNVSTILVIKDEYIYNESVNESILSCFFITYGSTFIIHSASST